MAAPSTAPFLALVAQSRLLAPALKDMTLRVFMGNTFAGNKVARFIVRDHLAALRWMNPNAVVFLEQSRGQGVPLIEYSLCACAAPCGVWGACGARVR